MKRDAKIREAIPTIARSNDISSLRHLILALVRRRNVFFITHEGKDRGVYAVVAIYTVVTIYISAHSAITYVANRYSPAHVGSVLRISMTTVFARAIRRHAPYL